MKSIGVRLTSIMICVTLLGISITLGVAVYISGSAITRVSLSGVQNDTESEALSMDLWLSRQTANIDTLSHTLSSLRALSEKQQANMFKSVMDANSAYFEVYMGYPDGTATTASGYMFDYSWWNATQRGWYNLAMTDTSRSHVTSPYVDAQTNELCITVARAVMRDGWVVGVVAADIFVTDLQEMTLAATLNSAGYAMLLDSNGDILVHPDADYAPSADGEYKNLASMMDGAYENLWSRLSVSYSSVKYRDLKGTVNYYTTNRLASAGWYLVTVMPARTVTEPINTVILTVIPLTLVILTIAALGIFVTVRSIVIRPITELVKAAADLSGGDTAIRVDKDYHGEMAALADAFQHIADSIESHVLHAESMAAGDLTAEIQLRSERDAMGCALRNLLKNLNAMVSEISSAAGCVLRGSEQIADRSRQLAQAASEQTSTAEMIAAATNKLHENTRANSEKAAAAAGLTNEIEKTAKTGSEQMEKMVTAVNEINEANESIEKVMKAIDDIAFQTNILALNAAVEAARAGSSGKGFAVVADEVRALAAKSAEAASETAALISNSVEKAKLGFSIARDTAESLAHITSGIQESTRLVAQIAGASTGQSEDIENLRKGIEQMSGAIYQNNSTAEESAATCVEMSKQSDMLSGLVAQFKLN